MRQRSDFADILYESTRLVDKKRSPWYVASLRSLVFLGGTRVGRGKLAILASLIAILGGLAPKAETQIGPPPFNPQFAVEVKDPTVDVASPLALILTQEDRQAYPIKLDLYFPVDWFANPSIARPGEILGDLTFVLAIGSSTEPTTVRARVEDHNGHGNPAHPTAGGQYHWIAREEVTAEESGEGLVWEDSSGRLVVHAELSATRLVKGKAIDARLLKLQAGIHASLTDGVLIHNPSVRGPYEFSARVESEFGQVVTRSASAFVDGPSLQAWEGDVWGNDQNGELVRGLESGVAHTLTAVGTYNYDVTSVIAGSPGRLADAECAIDLTQLDGSKWKTHRFDEYFGRDVLDLKVSENGISSSFEWTPPDPFPPGSLAGEPGCSQTNKYSTSFIPTTTDIRLYLDDVNHGDNSGSVHVVLTRG